MRSTWVWWLVFLCCGCSSRIVFLENKNNAIDCLALVDCKDSSSVESVLSFRVDPMRPKWRFECRSGWIEKGCACVDSNCISQQELCAAEIWSRMQCVELTKISLETPVLRVRPILEVNGWDKRAGRIIERSFMIEDTASSCVQMFYKSPR